MAETIRIKNCRECVHFDACDQWHRNAGIYFDHTWAMNCSLYMCLRDEWEWLNDLRTKGKEMNQNE